MSQFSAQPHRPLPHIGADGIAVGSCTLHDLTGAIGSSTVTAITNTSTLSQ